VPTKRCTSTALVALVALVFLVYSVAGAEAAGHPRRAHQHASTHHGRVSCQRDRPRQRARCLARKSARRRSARHQQPAAPAIVSRSGTGWLKGPHRTETAPSALVAPKVTGTPELAQTQTAEPGSWSGTNPIHYAYRWQRSGADIPGATSSSYTPGSADVGHQLDVVVTASNSVGSSSATSPPTATVSERAPAPEPTPAVKPPAPEPPAVETQSPVVNAQPTGPVTPEGGWHVAFADGFGAPLGTGSGQDNFVYPNENACCNPYENHHGDNTNELEAYNGIQDHITPEGLELVNAYHPKAMPAEGSWPVRNYLSGAASTRPQDEAGGWHGFTWEPGGGETWAFECNCQLPSNYPKYSGTDPGWWSTDQTWTNEFDFFESWGWNCNPLTSCGFGIAWVYNTNPVHTEESALYGMITKLFDPAAGFHRYTTVIYPNNTWSEYVDGQLQKWVGNNGVASAPPEFKRVRMALLLTNAIRDASNSSGPNPYPEFSTPGETRTFKVRSIAVYQDGAHAGRNVTGGGVAPGTTIG
jgi:hypothetical protein